ncbi:hypothetical protein BB560_001406 [Smittium megazygosporum]|uniref:Uncharacterized protein n=1 Tax=Smittium megazygosporum TaxID=133381 RepID=A0A2T9ZHP6_9FUNG|nr:hypothetical protein BB560_001406 [Smittium megazygosporum]
MEHTSSNDRDSQKKRYLGKKRPFSGTGTPQKKRRLAHDQPESRILKPTNKRIKKATNFNESLIGGVSKLNGTKEHFRHGIIEVQQCGCRNDRSYRGTSSSELDLLLDNTSLALSSLESRATWADDNFKAVIQPYSTTLMLENGRKNKRLTGVFPKIKALGRKKIEKNSTRGFKNNFLLDQGHKIYSKPAPLVNKRREKKMIIKIKSFLRAFNKIEMNSNADHILKSSRLMLKKLKTKVKNEASKDKTDDTNSKLGNKMVGNPSFLINNSRESSRTQSRCDSSFEELIMEGRNFRSSPSIDSQDLNSTDTSLERLECIKRNRITQPQKAQDDISQESRIETPTIIDKNNSKEEVRPQMQPKQKHDSYEHRVNNSGDNYIVISDTESCGLFEMSGKSSGSLKGLEDIETYRVTPISRPDSAGYESKREAQLEDRDDNKRLRMFYISSSSDQESKQTRVSSNTQRSNSSSFKKTEHDSKTELKGYEGNYEYGNMDNRESFNEKKKQLISPRKTAKINRSPIVDISGKNKHALEANSYFNQRNEISSPAGNLYKQSQGSNYNSRRNPKSYEAEGNKTVSSEARRQGRGFTTVEEQRVWGQGTTLRADSNPGLKDKPTSKLPGGGSGSIVAQIFNEMFGSEVLYDFPMTFESDPKP